MDKKNKKLWMPLVLGLLAICLCAADYPSTRSGIRIKEEGGTQSFISVLEVPVGSLDINGGTGSINFNGAGGWVYDPNSGEIVFSSPTASLLDVPTIINAEGYQLNHETIISGKSVIFKNSIGVENQQIEGNGASKVEFYKFNSGEFITIGRVDLDLKVSADFDQNSNWVRVGLFADSNGYPDGGTGLLASDYKWGADLSTTYSKEVFNFSYALTSSTDYWISMEVITGEDGDAYVKVDSDGGSDCWYSDGLTLSNNVPVCRIYTNDAISIGVNTADPNAVIDIEIQSATTKGLRMQGYDNQTRDYLQFVDSNSSEKFVVEADGDIQFRDKTIKRYSDDFGSEGSFSQTYNSNSDRNWMLGITDNDLYIYYYSGGGWVEHTRLERPGGIVGTSDINWRFDHEAGDYIIYYYNSDTLAWVEHSRFSKPSGVKSIYGLSNWSIRNETNLDFYYWNLNTLAWSAHSTFSKP